MVKVSSQKEKLNVLDLIQRISAEVERAEVSKERMLEDIKMMNLKVKPVTGDIFTLTNKDIGFVESLWKLGKIEEMISDKLDLLDEQDKDVFFNYLDDLQFRTQQQIAVAISELPKKERKKMQLLELEIFKDKFIDHTKAN